MFKAKSLNILFIAKLYEEKTSTQVYINNKIVSLSKQPVAVFEYYALH